VQRALRGSSGYFRSLGGIKIVKGVILENGGKLK